MGKSPKRNDWMKKLLVLLFLSVTFLTQAQAQIIADVDFTKGVRQPKIFGTQAYTSDAITVSNLTYNGQKRALFKLRGGNSSIYRSEVYFLQASNQIDRTAFVARFPSSVWKGKSTPWFIIAQWHGSDKKDPGEASLQPHIALFISGGRLKLAIHYDANVVTTARTIKSKTYDLGPLPLDQDLTFQFYNFLSYKSDGVTRLSINGKEVVNHRGPNNYNNRLDPYGYIKMGIYCRGLKSGQSFEYYLSNIRIGNAKATWQQVAP